jgi:hypothetical protein
MPTASPKQTKSRRSIEMDSAAEATLNGDFCDGCGVVIGRGKGIPRKCKTCGGAPDKEPETPAYSGRLRERRALEDAGFCVEVFNNGHHWVITKTVRADYWPSTDKFRIMNKGASMLGFRAMIDAIKRIKL